MNRDQHLAARARWAARRRRAIAYGTWQPFVDPEPVRDHIRALRAFGLSHESIALMAGEHPSALSTLMQEDNRDYLARIRPERAHAYLTVRFDLDRVPDARHVSSAGTARRIGALMAIGHSGASIARRLGISYQAVAQYRTRPSVAAATARAVRDVYDDLWDTPGKSVKAMRWAERNGWPPPLAWDDDTIDDPNATPHAETRHTDRTSLDTSLEVEDLLEIDPFLTADELGRRLGYSDRGGIQQALKRTGRQDLLDRLARNAYVAANTRRTA